MTVADLDLVTLTAYHARYLRSLIGESLASTLLPTASKAMMLAALQAAEIEFLQTISLVSEADRAQRPLCGVWSLHDLIGHLADWDRYFLNWLAVLTNDPVQDLYWHEDGDQFNAAGTAQEELLRKTIQRLNAECQSPYAAFSPLRMNWKRRPCS